MTLGRPNVSGGPRPFAPIIYSLGKAGAPNGVRIMAAATERFVAWCKQEQASIEQDLS